ncbi:MAG: hypothetical protein M1829_005553 [Trizodia sp. TS-e1964]|nr:MAG: hypothetical protein M1829_005553 [Trizodia sp. TS-e1964]
MSFLQRTLPAPSSSTSGAPTTDPSPLAQAPPLTPAQRTRRQLSLFAFGCTCVGLSQLITRRALVRRYRSAIPAFYQPSNRPSGPVNGAMEAFEALNIATANVASVGIMAAGGLLYAFDIVSLEDLRGRVRVGMGVEGAEASRAEEEFEEWLASVLARKERREGRGGAE